MSHPKALIKALPLVASVLGRKYGVQVRIGGQEAFTNGKIIQLPALPVEAPDDFLSLVRGYLDHEAGHVRETDFDAIEQANLSPLTKHIWNTLEDWRVEHKLAAIFPGCRQNFDWLIRHVFADGDQDAAPSEGATVILNWMLLEIRSWDVPLLQANRDLTANRMDELYPSLRPKIQAVLGKVALRCDSTADAIVYATEIVALLEREAPNTPKPDPKPNQRMKNRPQKAEECGNDQEDKGNSPRNEDTNAIQENPSAPCPSADQSSSPQYLEELLEAPAESLPKGLGQILAQSLRDSRATPMALASVATVGSKVVTALSDLELAEARTATNALRAKLHGLVQTMLTSRGIVGRKGKIMPAQLARLATSDQRVFARLGQRKGIDTAVHILLDSSGSMARRITLACQACYALASALQACGVNVGVTTFPAQISEYGSHATVAEILKHGQRVSPLMSIRATGGTPMGESLWWVLQQMVCLPEKRKIILIITDGEPDTPENTRQAISMARSFGTEVMGIGIGSLKILDLLPRRAVTINAMVDLAPAMFSMMQKTLTRSA